MTTVKIPLIKQPAIKFDYNTYRSRINSFGYLNCVDKLTFNPKSWFFAIIGHTARVYKDSKTGILYVYESTTLNQNRQKGVQLSLMSDWLKARKDCHVHYRGLAFRNEFDFMQAQKKFEEHIKKYRGTPYPDLSQVKWRWYLVNAEIDLPGKQNKLENVDQDKMMFCTQLSAHLDRYCGIIGENENPAEWEPDDCRDGAALDSCVLPNVVLLKEVEIYYGTC